MRWEAPDHFNSKDSYFQIDWIAMNLLIKAGYKILTNRALCSILSRFPTTTIRLPDLKPCELSGRQARYMSGIYQLSANKKRSSKTGHADEDLRSYMDSLA